MLAELTRIDDPTPHGGVYSIMYTHDDGSREIVEFDAEGRQVFRTYFPPPPKEPDHGRQDG